MSESAEEEEGCHPAAGANVGLRGPHRMVTVLVAEGTDQRTQRSAEHGSEQL